mgnify:FL=1
MSGIRENIDRKLHDMTYSLKSWRERYIPEVTFLFIVAFVIGLVSGFGAYLLKSSVSFISRFVVSGFNITEGNYMLLVLPLTGIFLASIYMHYVAGENLEHGTTRIKEAIRDRQTSIRPKLMYESVIGCSITLGLGGSAGAEGPIAYTGAAIGSNIGRAFRVSPRYLLIMIGCGAGAGIAGIFKAPVGGMLFTLEVLGLGLTTVSVMALLLACLTGGLTSLILDGCELDIEHVFPLPFDMSMMPYVLLLGVFCGLYSLYYSEVMKRLDRFFKNMKNHWVKNLIAGVSVSVLVFLLPPLFGEGYMTISGILEGNLHSVVDDSLFFYDVDSSPWNLVLFIGAVLLAKCFATSATNSGGGVGGEFAPTLFAGCMAGLFFALVMNAAFDLRLDTADFAFFGMSGIMAGAIHAPMTAIFLTLEMTGNYSLILPVAIVSGVSYGISRMVSPQSFFNSRYSVSQFALGDVNPPSSGEAPDDKS